MKAFLLRNRTVIIISGVLYLVSFLIGLFYPDVIPVLQEDHRPLGFLKLVQYNISAICMISLGFFTLGILSSILLAVNGLIFGFAISSALSKGISVWDICLSSIPHGIFEIPSLLLAGAIGFKSAEWIITKVFTYPKSKVGSDCLVLFGGAILLMLIAGLIEGFLTPRL
ncbi:stage II sporulation protein M [Thermoactinomyces sp. DSM 45892]|uniref:stage II sporulation protein M n=1 Tax=Thermoactinomyces sp. DSM 45892 TaxID=1882753 RepID=UPI0008949B81|nr:stage II sporulation protein M [Thermoactinomyces sp. DSM 45892]SDY72499.1 stage II sporulation protein M [Thermoactinomyces sp. DSM 45892]